jgi:osmotically-inducible protein OsmY
LVHLLERREELFWSPFVEGDEIDLRVENGAVTLYGTVDSWAEYNTVTNNAFEGGATRVNNNLIVR